MPCPNCHQPIDSLHTTTTSIHEQYDDYQRVCHIGTQRGENVLAVHGGTTHKTNEETTHGASGRFLKRAKEVFLNG